MRNQLETYINLLFAGNPEAEDIKEEILQNTLDRYDDLITQGRTPEAAYSLAISGIGDISEILGAGAQAPGHTAPANSSAPAAPAESEAVRKKRRGLRAVAVALYIACPVPLFLLQNEWGLCLLLAVVAAATALMIFAGKSKEEAAKDLPRTPQEKLKKSISDLLWTVGTIVYFIISFLTMAWHITWIIFPLLGAIEGLVNACLDLKEVK